MRRASWRVPLRKSSRPRALLATKRLLKTEAGTVAARIDEELEAFRAQLGSDEFKAAAQAFFAKGRG